MTLRRVIYTTLLLLMTFVSTEVSYAQEFTRERLRGNIRSINQGELVPIDSAALLKAQAEAAAHRDSIYYHFVDSIASIDNVDYAA